MATKLNFTFDGKDYTLEFTRKSVKQMEDRGFIPSRIVDAPMTVLPDLFAGAFLANHKFAKRETIDAIFDKMKNKRELIDVLSKMYNEPLAALMEEGDEGNGIEWTTE